MFGPREAEALFILKMNLGSNGESSDSSGHALHLRNRMRRELISALWGEKALNSGVESRRQR